MNTLKKHKGKIISGMVLLIIVLAIIFLRPDTTDSSIERYTAERADLVQTVAVSGEVTAQSTAELGFGTGGRVTAVYADEGDRVTRGQTIAQLDTARLRAQRDRAEADIAIRTLERSNQDTTTTNTSSSYDAVKQQQDSLVENAYRTLLSTDLIAEPRNDSYTQTPPMITGLYTGESGEYKIRVLKKHIGRDDYILRTFGIENWEGEASPNKAVALGTHGLYISFPESLENYDDTIWYVTIPNTKSTSYATNKNAYDSAVRAREVALEEARSSVEEADNVTPIRDIEIQKAQAEIAQLNADIADRVIRAPFTGVITERSIEVGETVTAGSTVMTMFGDDAFEIKANIPEIDIAKISVDDTAEVRLDAFDETVLTAQVTHISPAPTTIDGVSYYQVTLALDDQDPRIKSGMTADVRIVTDIVDDVIAIPQRFISDGMVIIERGPDIREEVVVTTGMTGDGSMRVITDGIETGTTIIRTTTND